jgi:AcrR family transcriptional regulator/CheY-like chemotaxis protein
MRPELRDLLVTAARGLLEEGEQTLDLRQVARRAGKSHTAPYVAFGSTDEGGGLEALRIAVAASGFDDLAADLEGAVESGPPGKAALARVGQAYFRFARRHVGLFRIMFGPEVARGIQRMMDDAGHPELHRLVLSRHRALRPIQAAVEEEQQKGAELEVPAMRAALAAWAMFHGAATLLIDGQFALDDLDAEAVNSLVLSFLPQPVEGLVEAADSLTRASQEKEHVGMDESASPTGEPRPAPAYEVRERPRHLDEISRSVQEVASPYGTPSRPNLGGPPPAFAASGALRRLRRNARAVEDAMILWVDDRPEWSRHEEMALTRLGATVIRAQSTAEAVSLEASCDPDVIISDIARPEAERAGLDGLPRIQRAYPGVPVIFYIGRLDPDQAKPPGSFGITNRPEELVHLILDVLERKRS